MSTSNPSRRRVVVCRGQYCNDSRRADHNLRVLQPLLDELNGGAYPPPIKLETANCLSMCGAGPNIVLYLSDGEVEYHHVKPADIPGIVDKHLR